MFLRLRAGRSILSPRTSASCRNEEQGSDEASGYGHGGDEFGRLAKGRTTEGDPASVRIRRGGKQRHRDLPRAEAEGDRSSGGGVRLSNAAFEAAMRGDRWRSGESEWLELAWVANVPIPIIAKKIGRSERAIRLQAGALGVSWKGRTKGSSREHILLALELTELVLDGKDLEARGVAERLGAMFKLPFRSSHR